MAIKMLMTFLILSGINDLATSTCGGIGQDCCCKCSKGLCENGKCCSAVAGSSTPPSCENGKCCGNVGNTCKSEADCCSTAPYCFGGQCSVNPGRPYNLLNNDNLHAQIINNCGEDINGAYINNVLSEHAAIGTFNKFSIELMNLGAPLWFIELSNQASIDEIRHAKVSFDIANMYLNS
eukprot:715652_1